MASADDLRKQAQNGKNTIKAAIVQFLAGHRGRWFKRSEIEDALGIGSTYKGDDGSPSYEGGLASMLLSELAEQDKKIDRMKDGQAWRYRAKQPSASQI